jgi:glycosyltransferase involved in cell wall biosynthesis
MSWAETNLSPGLETVRRSMKILLIPPGTNPVTPQSTGGVESYTHHIAAALAQLGNHVEVYDIQGPRWSDSRYRHRKILAFPATSNLLPFRLVRAVLFGLLASYYLKREVRAGEVDLVILNCHLALAFLLPTVKYSKIPFVYVNHNPVWSSKENCKSRNNKFKFVLEIAAMRNAATVVTMSKTVGENLAGFLGLNRRKIAHIPPGIDESWFALGNLVEEGDWPVVLCVARIARYKNQELIIKSAPRVLKEFPTTKFLFVGECAGRYASKMVSLINQLGLTEAVHLLGSVSFQKLQEIVSMSAIFVLPSLEENLPQALLQAMAAGKPCVISSIPSLKEVLADDRLLVSPRDEVSLARTIVHLLENRNLRLELGNAAKEVAWKDFTWNTVARKFLEEVSQTPNLVKNVASVGTRMEFARA